MDPLIVMNSLCSSNLICNDIDIYEWSKVGLVVKGFQKGDRKAFPQTSSEKGIHYLKNKDVDLVLSSDCQRAGSTYNTSIPQVMRQKQIEKSLVLCS